MLRTFPPLAEKISSHLKAPVAATPPWPQMKAVDRPKMDGSPANFEWNEREFNGLMGFNGGFIAFNGGFIGFNGDFMGLYGDFMMILW